MKEERPPQKNVPFVWWGGGGVGLGLLVCVCVLSRVILGHTQGGGSRKTLIKIQRFQSWELLLWIWVRGGKVRGNICGVQAGGSISERVIRGEVASAPGACMKTCSNSAGRGEEFLNGGKDVDKEIMKERAL